MSNSKLLLGAASNTLTTPLNVEEVFSTYLRPIPSLATQTIENGINFADHGGMVWIKNRTGAQNHFIYDHTMTSSSDGPISPNLTSGAATANVTEWTPRTNGFTIYGDGNLTPAGDLVTWSFRKAPKFFDVVTWDGDGTGDRTIPHELNHTVGMMLVKQTNGTNDWNVYHRRTNDGTDDERYVTMLHSSTSAFTSDYWTYTHPTTSSFTVRSNLNGSGKSYVAYLFAHHDGDGGFGPNGDKDIIKCGSFTGTGSNQTVDLGFEPQWILWKQVSTTDDWYIVDNMRGMFTQNINAVTLRPNQNAIENASSRFGITSTGFEFEATASAKYMYVAIRRGPMATPTSGEDVWVTRYRGEDAPAQPPMFYSGWPTDMAFFNNNINDSSSNNRFVNRLTAHHYMVSSTSDAASTGASSYMWDFQDGWVDATGTVTNYRSWMWRRAPGFYDTVAYDGNSVTGREIAHNLGTAPGMIWVKVRDSQDSWYVYHSYLGESQGRRINSTSNGNVQRWNNTAPTSTHFSVAGSASVNGSNLKYVAYLFGDLAGVSKIGGYTGSSSNQTIDCGFTNGARFILIKCTNVEENWLFFDTARGIVSGNDSRMDLNSTNAEDTSGDYIEPHASGFTLIGGQGETNSANREYIFYAIA